MDGSLRPPGSLRGQWEGPGGVCSVPVRVGPPPPSPRDTRMQAAEASPPSEPVPHRGERAGSAPRKAQDQRGLRAAEGAVLPAPAAAGGFLARQDAQLPADVCRWEKSRPSTGRPTTPAMQGVAGGGNRAA